MHNEKVNHDDDAHIRRDGKGNPKANESGRLSDRQDTINDCVANSGN